MSRWLTSRSGVAAVRRSAEIGRVRGYVALQRGLSAIYLEQLSSLADQVEEEDDRSKWLLLLALTIRADQIRSRLYPAIERTVTAGYRVTASIADRQLPPELRRPMPGAAIGAESRAAANVADNIARTTSEDLAGIISEAVKGNLSSQDLAAKLRLRKDYLKARAATAARTEVGIAWDAGALMALAEAGVRFISVVGCTGIEPEWNYQGRPTCNIQDVPIAEAQNLVFHPNHTGVMIPSAGPAAGQQ